MRVLPDHDFFEAPGRVSVWLGTRPPPGAADTLRDLCGVVHYSPDDQESGSADAPVSVAQLFDGVSYAASFVPQAIAAARRLGIAEARWMTAQFDFAYDPARVSRPIAAQPVFIGVFAYSAD